MRLLSNAVLSWVSFVVLGCLSSPQPRPRQVNAPINEAWRAQPPPVGPPPELVLPQFERATLPNGLTILVSERGDAQPVVTAELVFGAGSAADPAAGAGLASLTYALLQEGAGNYDALALDAAFASLGASPELSVDADGATLGVTVLREHAEAALTLLADLAQRPTLDREGFDRRKDQQLANIARRSSEPTFVGQQVFLARAFGSEHPYGHGTLGTRASVTRLQRADAQEFYAREVGPSTCALVFTGDVTLREAVAWATTPFGGWTSEAHRPEPPGFLEPASAQPIHAIEQSGLSQTRLLVGRPALPVGDPREAALQIATAAIGGMFSSRLNLNLRERNAYTYGAKAMLDIRRGPSPWTAYAAVRADATGAALNEVMSELAKLPSAELTQSEVDTARNGLIASLPGRFESSDDLASAAATIFSLETPLDRYTRLVASFREASTAHVNEVALQMLTAQTMTIVTVGDPAVLASQLPHVRLERPREIRTESAE
jgi:zinc protease